MDTGIAPTISTRLKLPPAIVASWMRSQAHGVDKKRPPLPPHVSAGELQARLAGAGALIEAARPHLEWVTAHFSSIRHVVYLTDADGIVLASYGDPEWQQLFGLLPGYDWSESAMGTNGAGTALASGAPTVVMGPEHFIVAFEDCTCVAAPVHDPSGQLIGAIDLSTALSDGNTERAGLMAYAALMIERDLRHAEDQSEWATTKRLMAELSAREEELRQTHERLQVILDNAPVLIYLVDDANRFLNVSTAWMRLSGLREASVIGRSLYDVFDKETAAQFEANNRLVLEAQAPQSFEETYEGRTYLSVKVPVRNAQGGAYAICGMSVDITERKRAEVLLLESEAALRNADQKKNEFIATVGHELRNPLAAIRTATHILDIAPSNTAYVVAIVQRQVDYLLRLVDDLLDISRITLGKMTFVRQVLDIRTVVDDALVATETQIRKAGHRLSVERPDDPLLVEGDRVRLCQVVSNLLTNAARYTPDHGDVRVEVRNAGEKVIISVEDSGIGLSADEVAVLFQPFTRSERATTLARGGLGIGLALVKTIVEAHGGSVEVSSAGKRRGSRFVVQLPLAANQQSSVVPTNDPPATS